MDTPLPKVTMTGIALVNKLWHGSLEVTQYGHEYVGVLGKTHRVYCESEQQNTQWMADLKANRGIDSKRITRTITLSVSEWSEN